MAMFLPLLFGAMLVMVLVVLTRRQESYESYESYESDESGVPPPGKSSAGAMVIVEPRAHCDLGRVLANFDQLGPPGYELVLFHGNSHKEHAMEATAGVQRQVTLHALGTDNLNSQEYSSLLKSSAFWEAIPAENVLVFQTDTALCSSSPNALQQFEDYAYLGCAVDAVGLGRNSHWGEHAFLGVGGLSFRKRSAMLQCIAAHPDTGVPEDVFFSDCVSAGDHGDGRVPDSARELSRFCSQNSFSEPSWGAHKTSLLTHPHKPAFMRYCPEAAFMT